VGDILHRSARAWRLLTVLLAIVLFTTPVSPASARDVRIRSSLFGMHDNTTDLASLDTLHEGWLRIWDSSVRWDHIETSPGVYDWTHLDSVVAQVAAHHAQATLVVAMTPSFYSRTPTNVPAGQVDRYRAFVRRLMTRYGDRVDSFQVWNEANIPTYWSGTPQRMARLTQVMDQVRDAVDPRAKVIAPSMVARLPYELKGIRPYFTQRIGHRPVWRYVDAATFSLYPLPIYQGRRGVPEDAIALLHTVKGLMHRAGVPRSMPIWDTEINYGLRSGQQSLTAAAPIPAVRQAANVVRTFLLQAAAGVARVGWYRYDWPQLPGGGTIGNTLLTDPEDSTRLTAAGRAYALVRTWMHGTLRGRPGHAPCPRDAHGTYRCVVSDARGTRYVYWNPFRKARLRLPARVRHWQGVLGATGTAAGGSRVPVDFRPVMYYR
jgi:hypothetical protein